MLDKLISEGDLLEGKINGNSQMGDEYEIWLNKCIRYIETYHKESALTRKFLKELFAL